MELLIPAHMKRASKPIAVVFYYNRSLDRIVVGAPEQFPAPEGFEKIVCRTASEVELWDKRLRLQEKMDQERTAEEREAVEAPIRDYLRKELVRLMLNSRNQFNRDFCKAALAHIDAEQEKNRIKTEAYMHIVAYEDGK